MTTTSHPDTLAASPRDRLMQQCLHEDFANLYADAAEAIAARRTGRTPDPLAMHFPNVEDGVRGARFVEATVESSAAGGAWTSAAWDG